MGLKGNEYQKTKGTEEKNGMLPGKDVLLHRSVSLFQSLFLPYSGLEMKLNLDSYSCGGQSSIKYTNKELKQKNMNAKWLISNERNNHIHCYREYHVRSQIIVKICWVIMKLESGEFVAIFLWPRLLSHEQNATFSILGHICYIESVILFMELCWHSNNCSLGLFFLFVHCREIHTLLDNIVSQHVC